MSNQHNAQEGLQVVDSTTQPSPISPQYNYYDAPEVVPSQPDSSEKIAATYYAPPKPDPGAQSPYSAPISGVQSPYSAPGSNVQSPHGEPIPDALKPGFVPVAESAATTPAYENPTPGYPPPSAEQSKILGLRRRTFWILLVVVIVVILGAGIGAGVGIASSKKNKDSENAPASTTAAGQSSGTGSTVPQTTPVTPATPTTDSPTRKSDVTVSTPTPTTDYFFSLKTGTATMTLTKYTTSGVFCPIHTPWISMTTRIPLSIWGDEDSGYKVAIGGTADFDYVAPKTETLTGIPPNPTQESFWVFQRETFDYDFSWNGCDSDLVKELRIDNTDDYTYIVGLQVNKDCDFTGSPKQTFAKGDACLAGYESIVEG